MPKKVQYETYRALCRILETILPMSWENHNSASSLSLYSPKDHQNTIIQNNFNTIIKTIQYTL